MKNRFDVIVIGGGQSGLAMGYYLRRTTLIGVGRSAKQTTEEIAAFGSQPVGPEKVILTR